MRTHFKFAVLIALAAFGSGCEATRQADGLTDGAGNSMASNSIMQMVDPWQDGVQDTRLLVPASRGTVAAAAAADAAGTTQSQTSTSN